MNKVPDSVCTLLLAVTIVSFALPWVQSRAQSGVDTLELRAARCEARLAELAEEQKELAARLEKATQKVAKLKEGLQNLFSRRRLESALRELQSLADAAEATERQQRQVNASLDSTLALLWAHYDAEINRLVAALDEEGGSWSPTQRQECLQAISVLRRKRAAASARMASVPAQLDSLPAWALTSEDDYRRLEDKAMLSQERAERVRQEGQAAEKRLRQLREELLLRKRLNELVREMALLDQRDETVRQAEAAGAEGGVLPTSFESTGSRGVKATTEAYVVLPPAGRLWSADPSQLSPAEAEQFIRQLEKERARLSALADTLAARAQALAQKAALLRTQQAPPSP